MSSEKRAGVPGQLAKEVAEFGLNSIIYVFLQENVAPSAQLSDL